MILVSSERCLAGISSKVMDVQTGLFVNNQLCHSSGCWTGVAIKILWWLVVMAFFLVSLLCCESWWCAGEQCREYVFSQSGSEVLCAIASYIFAFPMQKQKQKTFMVLGMQSADMVYCVAVSEGDSCCQLLVCKTQGCQDAAIIVLLFLVCIIHLSSYPMPSRAKTKIKKFMVLGMQQLASNWVIICAIRGRDALVQTYVFRDDTPFSHDHLQNSLGW